VLSYENGRFYIQDMGSSNGSFINNIRLTKSGEQSKPTQLYSGDIIRFGSDVLDKCKNVTQRAIVSSIKLFHADGTENTTRPQHSKLFRPMESIEEVNLINQSLQESFNREKQLEDRLLKVREMISKHIGRSQSDMVRIYEDIKEELMKPYEVVEFSPEPERSKPGRQSEDRQDREDREEQLNQLRGEKFQLGVRLSEIEAKLVDREEFCRGVQARQQEDNMQIAKLRQLIDRQNGDIEQLELALADTQQQLDSSQGEQERALKQHYDNKIVNIQEKNEVEVKQLVNDYESKLRELEESFCEERNKMRQQVQEVTSNEIGLLEKIKSLESDQDYSRAEVDRIISKDAENFQYKQRLEYRIECLTVELEAVQAELLQAQSNVVVQRSEEDINTINAQEEKMTKLRDEVSYMKQELIESRSRRAAIEDDLNAVQGTTDSLNNAINALTTEGDEQKSKIATLEEQLHDKIGECTHLNQLLVAMESQPSQDGKLWVEVEDLKSQLKTSQADLKSRQEEVYQVQDEVRLREETIQQRDIDISRLNGQIQFLEEEKTLLKSSTGDVESLQIQLSQLKGKLNLVIDELEVTREDNTTLSSELEQQQVLYTELKKMRGMGEELQLLQNTQRDLSYARERGDAALQDLQVAHEKVAQVESEKMRLLREMAALKSGRTQDALDTDTIEHIKSEPAKLMSAAAGSVNSGAPNEAATTEATNSPPAGKKIGEKLAHLQLGSLHLYEILLGLFFLSVVVSWHPFVI